MVQLRDHFQCGGHFRSGDHLRFNFGIISGPRIICSSILGSFPVQGSFAVQFHDHFWSEDHLRSGNYLQSNLGIISSAGIICRHVLLITYGIMMDKVVVAFAFVLEKLPKIPKNLKI